MYVPVGHHIAEASSFNFCRFVSPDPAECCAGMVVCRKPTSRPTRWVPRDEASMACCALRPAVDVAFADTAAGSRGYGQEAAKPDHGCAKSWPPTADRTPKGWTVNEIPSTPCAAAAGRRPRLRARDLSLQRPRDTLQKGPETVSNTSSLKSVFCSNKLSS